MKKLDENCILLGYYAASSSNSQPMFRDNLMGPLTMGAIGFILEDGTDSLPRNAGKELQLPLRNNPEERSYVVGDGSPKSRMKILHRTLTTVCRR